MEKKLPLIHETNTVTVLRSSAGMTATGQAGLVVETKEAGTIAFAVPLQVVPKLRKSLDEIERFLTRGKSH